MMKRLFLYVLILLSVAAKAQNDGLSVENAPVADDVPLGQLVTTRLDALIGEMQQRDSLLDTSQLGLMVWDLTSDTLLYAHNHRQLMRTASTMKLLTAITALFTLGTDYEFSTSLYYKGTISQGVLNGDLFCLGGMDPMFDRPDMQAFVKALKAKGVTAIRGRIVMDYTMKEPEKWGEGWCWDDDNPYLIPLTIGRKDNFTSTLAEEISRLGINLEGVQLMQGRKPDNAKLLDACCHSITQVLQKMMKDSDNFYAESMFYQTAASTGHRPAKAIDARNVTKKLINRLGLDANAYRIADGSGLSLYNYVTAELLVRLLRHAWRTPSISKALIASLPVAGVDGTLKSRMLKTPAQGNVRAKTGTLTGISSLAGYCTTPNGHELAFAIINQGILDKTTGKAFQDRVCRVLCGENLGVKEVRVVKGAKKTSTKAKPTTRSRAKAKKRRR